MEPEEDHGEEGTAGVEILVALGRLAVHGEPLGATEAPEEGLLREHEDQEPHQQQAHEVVEVEEALGHRKVVEKELQIAAAEVCEHVARLVEGQWAHAAHIGRQAATEHHEVLAARLRLLVPEEQRLAGHEDASQRK